MAQHGYRGLFTLLQRCLRDILDGFFPTELQRLYPDGVPFKVTSGSSTHPFPVCFEETGDSLLRDQLS